jgi:hypothetical protein
MRATCTGSEPEKASSIIVLCQVHCQVTSEQAAIGSHTKRESGSTLAGCGTNKAFRGTWGNALMSPSLDILHVLTFIEDDALEMELALGRVGTRGLDSPDSP